jgi:hypothetical protein
MMISQPALLCLNATWQRLIGRSASDLHPAAAHALETGVDVGSTDVLATVLPERPRENSGPVEGAGPVPTARARDDIAAGPDPSTPLNANERRARAAALRALALSRGRRFDAAGAAFTEAARLDPLLDLTRTPAFWKLERAAHEAAIAAYVKAGRERDAAVLRARVQSTFRPKPIRPRQHVVLNP